jgi:hypothetical protein
VYLNYLKLILDSSPVLQNRIVHCLLIHSHKNGLHLRNVVAVQIQLKVDHVENGVLESDISLGIFSMNLDIVGVSIEDVKNIVNLLTTLSVVLVSHECHVKYLLFGNGGGVFELETVKVNILNCVMLLINLVE